MTHSWGGVGGERAAPRREGRGAERYRLSPSYRGPRPPYPNHRRPSAGMAHRWTGPRRCRPRCDFALMDDHHKVATVRTVRLSWVGYCAAGVGRVTVADAAARSRTQRREQRVMAPPDRRIEGAPVARYDHRTPGE